MFLRIAGDRRGRADVRRHRHGQQVGHRPASQRERQLQHQRRQDQADRIVHQEGGKDAGDRHDRAQQDQRSPGMPPDPGVGDGEEARERRLATTIIMRSSSVMVSRSPPCKHHRTVARPMRP